MHSQKRIKTPPKCHYTKTRAKKGDRGAKNRNLYEVGTKYNPVRRREDIKGLRLILPQSYEIIHYISFHLLPFTKNSIKDMPCEVNHIPRDGKHAVACPVDLKGWGKNIRSSDTNTTEVQKL